MEFSGSSDVYCGGKVNERRRICSVSVGVRGVGSWLVGWLAGCLTLDHMRVGIH